MSSIDDEIVRAKMRKLRVSTFADIFYEVVNDEAYADALPEDIFLAAVEEAYTQRQQRNIAKAITQAQFRYPDASLAEITRAEQRGINMGPDPRKVDTSGVNYATLASVAEVAASKTSGATRLHQEWRLRVL